MNDKGNEASEDQQHVDYANSHCGKNIYLYGNSRYQNGCIEVEKNIRRFRGRGGVVAIAEIRIVGFLSNEEVDRLSIKEEMEAELIETNELIKRLSDKAADLSVTLKGA